MKNFGFYFFAFCILVIAIGLGSLLGVYVFLKLISKNVTKKDLEDRENQITQEAQKKEQSDLEQSPWRLFPYIHHN
jgi:succinate dehydrogenase/fumarate reductase flavoprotein subunit